MLNKKTLMTLAIVTVVIIVAVIFLKPEQRVQPSKQTGTSFIPGLLENINNVNRITVASKNFQFELVTNEEKQWVIKDKDNYPAQIQSVRKLLVGSANLEKIEPKTKNPEYYSKLGVGKIDAEEAKSVLIGLYKGDEKLAEYYLGDKRSGGADDQMYVRMKDAEQSWLVDGYVNINKSPVDWLVKEIIDIDQKRVQRVTVQPKEGEVFTIFKDEFDARNFNLAELPEDKEIESAFAVNNIANTFAKLKLKDVTADAAKDPSGEPDYTATLETFGGMRAIMQVKKIDDKYYAKLDAEYDESIIALKEPEKPELDSAEETGGNPETAEAESTTDTADNGDEGQTEDGETKKKAEEEKQKRMAEYESKVEQRKKRIEQAKKDAETYAAKWKGWHYVLSNQAAEAVGKNKTDLYKKEKEEQDEEGEQPGGDDGSEQTGGE